MDITLSSLSPEALEALKRYVSYGWMPAVIAKLMSRSFPLSLNAHDVSLLLAELSEATPQPAEEN